MDTHKGDDKPVLRLFCTGRGTRVEFMGRDVSKGMTYFKYEHNAKERMKPEVTMVFDMSLFEPLEENEFDTAYERYCELLKNDREKTVDVQAMKDAFSEALEETGAKEPRISIGELTAGIISD